MGSWEVLRFFQLLKVSLRILTELLNVHYFFFVSLFVL